MVEKYKNKKWQMEITGSEFYATCQWMCVSTYGKKCLLRGCACKTYI